MHTTPASLLKRLRQPSDEVAWSHFVKLYTPLLYAWLHGAGCPAAEADDLVQDVLAALVEVLPQFEYDQDKTFRGWLRKVAVNKWRENQRRRRLDPQPLGDHSLPDELAADPAEQFWEEDYRQHLLGRALQLMQTDFPEKAHLLADGGRGPERRGHRCHPATHYRRRPCRQVPRPGPPPRRTGRHAEVEGRGTRGERLAATRRGARIGGQGRGARSEGLAATRRGARIGGQGLHF